MLVQLCPPVLFWLQRPRVEMARARNVASAKDIKKVLKGNGFSDAPKPDKYMTLTLDEIVAEYKVLILDLLKETSRPTVKVLLAGCLSLFPEASRDFCKPWCEKLVNAISHCRSKRSCTSVRTARRTRCSTAVFALHSVATWTTCTASTWAGSSGIRECAELAGKLRADRHTSHEVETSVGAPAQLLQSLESRGEVQGMRKLSLFQRKQLPPKLKGRAMQIQALGEPLLLCWQHFMNKGLEIHLKIENYLKVNLALEKILHATRTELAMPPQPSEKFKKLAFGLCQLHRQLREHFQGEYFADLPKMHFFCIRVS